MMIKDFPLVSRKYVHVHEYSRAKCVIFETNTYNDVIRIILNDTLKQV